MLWLLPERFPEDSCWHFTRREYEEDSCTRSKRSVGWISWRITRASVAPIPGTVRSRNKDCRKVLLAVSPGTKESMDCWREFLEDLKCRGLPEPVLVVTEEAPGLIRSLEECLSVSLRQRPLAHKIRKIASKLPGEIRVEFTEAARASYQAPSPAMARALRDDLVERYEKECPSAVACFLENFEACIAHLWCPPADRRVIRTTDLLERLFREERGHLGAAGTMFGERPVLKMMYAALVRAAD